MMLEQNGFDFGDEPTAFVEDAPEAWGDVKHTAEEYSNLLISALQDVQGIVGVWRVLFEAGIERAAAEGTEQMQAHQLNVTKEKFWFGETEIPVTYDQVQQFLAHCSPIGNSEGIEQKLRKCQMLTQGGMYVEGVGTLHVRVWAEDNWHIVYVPYRSKFFTPSFRDDAARVALSRSVWWSCYSGMKLAESGHGVASLKGFQHGGRLYVQSGMTTGRNTCECDGWRVCAPSDWRGPTYSYAGLIAAWNSGRKERGDKRGLLVKVNNRKCILDACTVFFDPEGYKPIEQDAAEEDQDLDGLDDEEEGGDGGEETPERALIE